MMEVKFWRDIITKSGDLFAALRAGKLNASFVEANIDGIPPSFTPKPFHSLFIALFSLTTGLTDEWVGCLWSALVGTLTILLVGWWTARHFGNAAGILAALLLAVSRSHVMYSRSQLAEADAIFFACLAIFMHVELTLRSRRDAATVPDTRFWPALGVGLLYGIAVAVNYRCLLLLPLVFLWDIWTARNWFNRLASLCIGILAIACLIEIPYRIYIWRGGSLPGGMMTYFQGFWSRMFQDLPMGEKKVTAFIQPHLDMLRAYGYLESPIWLIPLALGLWSVSRNRDRMLCLTAVLAVLPLAVFSLVTRGDGTRAVMTSIPFLWVLISLGFIRMWEEFRDSFPEKVFMFFRFGAGILLAVVIFAFFAVRIAYTEPQTFSAWPETGRWLREQPRDMVYTTYPLAVRYYLRKDQVKLVPKEDTAPIAPGMYVIDRYNATYAYPYPVVQKVISTYKPVRVFEGLVYPNTGLFLDWGVFVRSANWREELKRENMGRIEIYRVPAAGMPLPQPQAEPRMAEPKAGAAGVTG